LCGQLAAAGHTVRAALRGGSVAPQNIAERVVISDIGAATVWDEALAGVEAVVHLAARAHVLNDSAANASQYLDVNTSGTRCLAAACVRAGVRRFVYVSSIKVNGEASAGAVFSALDEPRPLDAYGRSKLLAEQALLELFADSDTSLSMVRPPLVYGPGVRANFLRLLQWVDRELPLPLAAVDNRRSLVSVWNLCDLLTRLLSGTVPAGRVWLVSDGMDLSTPGLIRRIGAAMDRRVRLLPVPVAALRFVAGAIGRRAEVDRLCGSLQLDILPTCRDLDWTPPVSVDDSIARTVEWYLRRGAARGAQ
jgi:UDP-N-acetyl-alpha-D-quinovosamine dehydrogenase